MNLQPLTNIIRPLMNNFHLPMNIQRIPTLLAALLLTLGLAACGSAEGEDVAPAAAFTIEPVGNKMEFAKKNLTVEAGQQVTITFKNTASTEAMKHNVVVLKGTGDDVIQRVGQAALQAGAPKEYVPNDPAVLASTALAAPGETVEVTFTAPSEPGTYSYICTFPGHYMMMRGTMTVTA